MQERRTGLEPFALCGKMVAHPGKRDQLLKVLLRAAEELGKTSDCQLYIVNLIDDEPDAVWVTELWKNRDAHARSLENENVRSLIQEGRPLIAHLVQPVRMTPVGGKGLG